MIAKGIRVSRAIAGVMAKQIAAPMIDVRATLHTIRNIRSGFCVIIRGPGEYPKEKRAPKKIAAAGPPGTLKRSVGTRSEMTVALLAPSAAATPRTSPFPKRVRSRDVRMACP